MKGLKILLILISLFLVAVLHVNAANAAIVWDDIVFRYAVDDNSATIYTDDSGNGTNRFATPVAVSSDDVPPVSPNNSVDSSIPTDTSGLGLQFNAGAGGQLVSQGVRVDGYAETSTTSGGVLDPYSIGDPASQAVHAHLNRTFHVDGNEAAILSGMAGGIINDPGFFVNGILRAEYEWEGAVTLDEIVTIQGIPLVQTSWEIGIDTLLNDGPQQLPVALRTQDASDNPIFYILRTNLDLLTEVVNAFPLGGRFDDIPVGALGALGDSADPLWIQGTIEADTGVVVPIPGSVILLLSGIAGVVGLRKRRS